MGNCLITRRSGTSGGGGGTSGCYWLIKYYNNAGNQLLHEEYVLDGGNAIYGTDIKWSATISPTSEDWQPNILNSVHSNLNVYKLNAQLTAIIPAMTSYTEPSGEASASSTFNSYYAWKAFDRITTRYDQWLADTIDETPWIQYTFESPHSVAKIDFSLFSDQDYDLIDNVYIEGLVNNQWVNLLPNGNQVEINSNHGNRGNSYSFDLNETTCDAIRIRGTQAWFIWNPKAVMPFTSIQVYENQIS